ncbi:hypothetical protein KFL_014270015 [Klebsormidium nitens]|uniref:Uncharacterized protein n=1 Tax=Klebsormidium nitens TaxID=105231 RepID=A0A1Y1IV88_KLENI|nr:hypothetical protein KFL_014270015 [Klebsormidium nitens]|eukprot:GAQ93301.1 hypothetical protein KFL_014270015 [Klebsormidium nitens]
MGLSNSLSLLGKGVGKLIMFSALIHGLAESETALALGLDPGAVRILPVIQKRSVEMALRVMDMFDRQKMTFVG